MSGCSRTVTVERRTAATKKLSYKEQRELDALPARIEALEAEQRDLNARIAGPDFYKAPRTDIDAALARVDPLATGAYRRLRPLARARIARRRTPAPKRQSSDEPVSHRHPWWWQSQWSSVWSPFSLQVSLQYFPHSPPFATMHSQAGCAHFVVSAIATSRCHCKPRPCPSQACATGRADEVDGNADTIRAMRVLNRTAVSITAKQPYIDWTRKHDADASKGMLTVRVASANRTARRSSCPNSRSRRTCRNGSRRTRRGCSSFSCPRGRKASRPGRKTRDFKTFREWFRIDIHSTVVDDAEERNRRRRVVGPA